MFSQFAKLYSDVLLPSKDRKRMKLGGFLLLLSGWAIVAGALTLLRGGALSAFIVAGLAVEILGLALVAKSHIPLGEDNG
jgi:hypothetical protein